MNKMKSTRKALKLSQQEMAKAIGLSQGGISKMENGTLPINRRTSLALDALKEKKAKQGRVINDGSGPI